MSPFNHRTMRPRKRGTGSTRGPRDPRVTLHFDGSSDDNWATLSNWWRDSGHSLPAAALPNQNNNVVLAAAVVSNSGDAPTVHNLTVDDPGYIGWSLGVPVTVQGTATFTGASTLDSSVVGNAAFADASSNGGTVYGNATFDNSSTNAGTVTGDATVNYPVVRPLGGTVTGTTFYVGYPFFLVTEDGYRLTSEAGELLVTEQFE